MAHLEDISPGRCPGYPRHGACRKPIAVRVRGQGGNYGEYCRGCGQKRLDALKVQEQRDHERRVAATTTSTATSPTTGA